MFYDNIKFEIHKKYARHGKEIVNENSLMIIIMVQRSM